MTPSREESQQVLRKVGIGGATDEGGAGGAGGESAGAGILERGGRAGWRYFSSSVRTMPFFCSLLFSCFLGRVHGYIYCRAGVYVCSMCILLEFFPYPSSQENEGAAAAAAAAADRLVQVRQKDGEDTKNRGTIIGTRSLEGKKENKRVARTETGVGVMMSSGPWLVEEDFIPF